MNDREKSEDIKEIPLAFKEMEELIKGGIPKGKIMLFAAYTDKTKSKLESN